MLGRAQGGEHTTVLFAARRSRAKSSRGRHYHNPTRDPQLREGNFAALPNAARVVTVRHDKVAYTGADAAHRPLEQATAALFLDEVGYIAGHTAKFSCRSGARFDGLGGTREQKVDVRLIAATNRDPVADGGDGAFRETSTRLNSSRWDAAAPRRKEEIVALASLRE